MALPFLDSLQSQPNWFIILFSLGLLTITKLTLPLPLLYYSYAYFLRPAKDLKSRYGQWAVVTGPTDGIGKFMAIELARKGLHLVLVGRNPAKLSDVSTTIHAELPNTMIKSVVIDLAGDLDEGVRRLKEAAEGIDVGVLVNNAGLLEPVVRFFHEMDVELWMRIVRVNLEAPVKITQAVLPGMMEKRRGAIVIVGSASSVAVPSYPLFTVYSSTKAFVDRFSKSLHVEYESTGIDVQCQVPMYVATKMISDYTTVKWYNSLFMPSAKTYAFATTRWIGYEAQCIPYVAHFLQYWFFHNFMPDFMLNQMFLRDHIKEREKLLRCKQQD